MPNSNFPLDLLTIGDSSIDLFMKVPSNDPSIEDTKSKMCFLHGSKIMVESFSTSISGNAINVSIGTSLLGIKSGVYTETGDDQYAERIIKELKNNNVNTNSIVKNKNTETALHSVIVYSGERTIFSYHGKRKYSVKNINKPKFIYYTSLGEGFKEFQDQLVDFVRTSHVGLAFNPGTFQMAQGVESLKNILNITDILFVNKEEAIKLTKIDTNSKLLDLHKKLFNLGVKISVITDGKNGASAYDGKIIFLQSAHTEAKPVVDMTGAGDAFSAGFMSAIIYGKTLKEALKWGAINSSAQIRVIGSAAGMLTKDKLEKLL